MLCVVWWCCDVGYALYDVIFGVCVVVLCGGDMLYIVFLSSCVTTVTMLITT